MHEHVQLLLRFGVPVILGACLPDPTQCVPRAGTREALREDKQWCKQ